MSITPQHTPLDELQALPEHVQAILLDVERDAQHLWDSWQDYSHTETSSTGQPIHYDRSGRIMDGRGPSNMFFGLTYASWLTIPRLSLQEMPPNWQAAFYALLEEAEKKHGLRVPDGIHVVRKGAKNRYVENDHWNNYRHGTVADAVATDEQKGLNVW